MLNLALMKHWENWATIILMVLIASFGFEMVARHFTKGSE